MEVTTARPSPATREDRAVSADKRVFVIQAASPLGFMEAAAPESERVMISGHGNRAAKNFAKAFESMFKSVIQKTGFSDMDDAPFFRYGVMFRLRMLRGSMAEVIKALSEWLQVNLPEGATSHIVVEDKALSIRLNFGDYDEPTNAIDAVVDLRAQTAFIDEAMAKARRYTEDIDDFWWVPFLDWDELEAY